MIKNKLYKVNIFLCISQMNFAVVRRNMSATRCALLILVASIIFDGSTAKECSTLECPDTFVWSPRCGSDGKTYGNDCEVKMAQCLNPDLVEIHDGPCTNIKRSVKRSTPLEFQCHPNMKLGFCTNEYNPVCGNDGKTYPNHCCLCAAKYNGSDNLKVISRGPCNEKQLQDKSYLNPGCSEQVLKIQCTQDEFPLCGTDGKTYGNACKFCKGLYALKTKGTQLNVAHLGQCKPKHECPPEHLLDACPLVFQPICADDGNTYTNLCRLCAKMYKTGKRLKYLHEGLCQRPAHDEIQMECRPYETEGFCTNKYVPVCGSNGKTYGNKCTLCHAMVEDRNLKLDHFGVCDSKEVEVTTTEVTRIECNQTEKVCSQEYSPVCASDGTTLHNKCAFCSYKFSREKDGVQVNFKHTGECKPQEYCIPMSMFGACPYTYFPVCATDGNTYPNLCVMCAEMYRQRKNGNSNFVLRKVYDGICGFEPPMYYEEGFCNEYLKAGVCSTWEYSPYCGSDGQTYANKCQFCQEMYKQKQNGEILNVRIEGECPENFKCGSESLLGACPYTYLPVCGSNGVTYSNDCLRCAEMHKRQEKGENIFIYVKYKGECPK